MTTAASSLMLNVDQELDQLPEELFWDFLLLYQWQGFSYNTASMKGMLAFQSEYEALSNDVFLASFPKKERHGLRPFVLAYYSMETKEKALIRMNLW